MPKYTKIINYFIYLFFTISWVLWFIFAKKNDIPILTFGFFLLANVSFRHLVLYKRESNLYMAKILMFFDLFFCLVITTIDTQNYTYYIYDVLIAQSILFYPKNFSIKYTLFVIISCMVGILANNYHISHIYRNLLSFMFVYCFMLLVKILNLKSSELYQTSTLLEEQRELLTKTNKSLQQSIIALEEMIVLKERNRIAREIHDSVGHALTAVIVQIEAAKRLIEKGDLSTSVQKIDQAQGQIRSGLDNIRKSVKTLKDGGEILDFEESISTLIKDTEISTGVKIDYEIKNLPKLNNNLQRALYRSLQEGLTNGIKHGKSKHFGFFLYTKDKHLIFLLKDNGKGCEKIIPGFGITVMKERAEEFGGNFYTESFPNCGCTIKITFPILEG